MTDAAARKVGRYMLEGASWSGASGQVWLGRDPSGARVALKLSRVDSDSAEESFAREVALLARLSRTGHPGVPALLDSGRHEGRPFLVTRFMEGRTLRAVADELWPAQGSSSNEAAAGPPPAANGQLSRVLAIARSLARTLAVVHAQGIVHCDLNPANVVIEPSGSARLVDFGSATSAFSVDSRREPGGGSGSFQGTVGYAAPEQLSGHALDSRCDLYALGCILYELCTGRLPFGGGDARAVAAQHLYAVPPRPSARVAGLPGAIESLILRLLAKDRRERPAFGEDVARELGESDPSALDAAHREAAVHLYRASLIGRDDALARLLQAARDAAAGRGGWVVVKGESGIGKTRIIAELGQRLGRQSVLVAYGACGERAADGAGARQSPPLEPFRALFAALERRLARGAAPVLERLAPSLAALAPYHPSLAELPGVAGLELPALPLALGRKRVLRALRECLVELSGLLPVVVVLDDLHAADELTREFLASEHVSELKAERVLLLGACRPEQVDEPLAALIRANASAELALERMTLEDVRQLVKEMLAEEFPPNGFVDYLHRQSEGNPFFVAEYLRVALDTGAIARNERSQWTFPELNPARREPYAQLPTPDSLSALARIRLASAPEPERRLLQLCAIFGRRFDTRQLAPLFERLAPGAPHGLHEALQELVRRQLLETDEAGRHHFAHDKLREAALTELSADAAVELHRAVAELLERSAAGAEASELDAEIGTHWAYAREPARAVQHLSAAARRADNRHAHEQAIDLYALAVEQALAAASESEATRLSELLADLLCRTAKYDRARKQYTFTIERTAATEPLSLARLWRKYAEAFWRVHEHKQALQALERAERHLGAAPGARTSAGPHVQEWISLQQARLTIHYFSDPHGSETRVLIDELLPVVTLHGSPEQKSYFFQCAANERAGRQRYRFTPELVELERRAVAELTNVAPTPVLELASAQFDLAFMLLLGGRAECEEAVPLLLHALGCAEEHEDMTLLARSLNYLSIAHRRLGELERTQAYSERTRRVAELAQLEPYLGAVAANLGWLAWRRGQLDEATALVQRARAWWVRAEHVFPFQWVANWVRLELQASSDDFPAARATLDDLLAPLQQAMPEPLERALGDARSACQSGVPGAAARALQLALELARELSYL